MCVRTLDWSELDPDAKAQVAKQVYLCEGLQRELSDGGHVKIPIAHEHRSAMIDIPLAPIIRCLWRNGFETIACCQNDGHAMNPHAYIAFLSAEHGGEFFLKLLRAYVIEYQLNDFKPELAFPIGRVRLHTVNVSFPHNRIEALWDALREIFC